MPSTWFVAPVLLLAFGVTAAQTAGTAQTDNNSQSSSTTQNPANTSTGANQSHTSQAGATGASGNTSAVGSSSANPSTPISNDQGSTKSGANNAYPTSLNSAGNDQVGAQATATGASTGVGVSADPKKNKKTPKGSANHPQADRGTTRGNASSTPRD